MFASLNDTEESEAASQTTDRSQSKIDLDEVINNAKTVNGLLNIAESQNEISRKHALKVEIEKSFEISVE